MQTISFSYRVGHSTVCEIIGNTCDAIWKALMPVYLHPPQKEEDWRRISADFENLWNFPNCVGAIDGKHVVIRAPNNAGSEYYNYKGTHSIVLLAICDANYNFTFVDIGDNGCHSDAGVFSNSSFGKAMDNNQLHIPPPSQVSSTLKSPYLFVGDEAFPLKTYMLRPYPGRFLNDKKRVFNYRLSRARRTIENAFGILAARWGIYRRPIHAQPNKVEALVKATCCLHNFLKVGESHMSPARRTYCPNQYVDSEDRLGQITLGQWRNTADQSTGMTPIARTGANCYTQTASQLRDNFADYFISLDGKVPWQENIL